MTIPSIVARSISKTYRRGRQLITALQNVAFEVSQGELVLLIGPSGSGKTTLLNLIAALDRPDRGEILVDGLDVTGLSRSASAGSQGRGASRIAAVDPHRHREEDWRPTLAAGGSRIRILSVPL